MKKNSKRAFTMAEILISLTIIGVIATMALPSMIGNVKEKVFNTRRVALYSRLSQALGVIGELSDVGKYQEDGTLVEDWEEKVAMTFVVKKLSHALAIENTCDSEHLRECGFNDRIIRVNSTGADVAMPTDFETLINNAGLSGIPNTKAAAFVTKNGDSVAVYYNPDCLTKIGNVSTYAGFVCLNFIYDLNGLDGPNTIGKDVGVATALYATAPNLVMPVVSHLTGSLQNSASYSVAVDRCSAQGMTLFDRDELVSLAINKSFMGMLTGDEFWSGSLADDGTKAWVINLEANSQVREDLEESNRYTCKKRLTE